MRLSLLLCLPLMLGTAVQAQTISLRGTVKNESGSPIAGAMVGLDSKQLKDTTDATGGYSLSGGTNGVFQRSLASLPVTLEGSLLTVQLSEPSLVRIQWLDLAGTQLAKVEQNAPAGKFLFDPSQVPVAGSMHLVRVSIGSQATTFRMIRANRGERPLVAEQIQIAAMRSMATVDSLKVSATGYLTKTVPLSSYEATVDVTLSAVAACNPADKTPDPVKVTATLGGRALTGAHQVVIETDPGLAGKTIYRPSDLGPGKKYPILVWGNGACARNSTETADYYAEIASHGYVVINEGTPGGKESYDMGAGLGTLGGYLIKGFDWALQQNGKPCSRFYQSLDTMVGSFGWSCGGLMAYGASLDPRVDATIIMSSGLLNPDQATLNKLHAPIAYAIGGPDDMAYPNGLRDFNGIAHLPTVFANVPSAGHGGTYWADNGGEFAKFAVAWFNWFLKGDTGATGRQKFIGNTCGFCSGQWSSMQTKKLP